MNNTLFYHGKTVDGRRFTIAGKFNPEPFGDLSLGIAICSEEDQFIKKAGRHKAEGRINAASPKGRVIANLYSTQYFKPANGNVAFLTDWFVGKELNVFLDLAKKFNTLTVKELQKEFNVYQREPAF